MPFLSQRLGCPLCTLDAGLSRFYSAGQQGTPLPRHIALEGPRAAFPGVPERERPHGSCGRAALLLNLGTQIGNRGEEDPLQTIHPSKEGTIFHRPKNSPMRSMPLLKKRRKWEWSWTIHPTRSSWGLRMYSRPTLSGTNGRDPRIRQGPDNIWWIMGWC